MGLIWSLIVGAIIAIVSGGAGFRHQPPFEESGGAAVNGDEALAGNRTVARGGRH